MEQLLQDLIKEKMKGVFDELTEYKPYTLVCEGCNIAKIALCHRSYILEEFVCSKKCINAYVCSLPFGHPYKKSV